MKPADLVAMLEAIEQHIRCRVADYYPQLGDVPIVLRQARSRRRQFSVLCDFDLSTSGWQQTLMAKIVLPDNTPSLETTDDRIRTYFVGTPDPPGAEWAALSASASHLNAQSDSRFFAVRVLDSLLDDRALLLERVQAVPLTRLLRSASCLGGSQPATRLVDAVHRAGVWLRIFHGMPVSPARQERGTTKCQFLDWLQASGDFFAQDPFGERCFERIRPRICAAADELLPQRLPTGPLHADFAPRNILVDSQGRVAVIDFLDQWVGCIWEDVAQFLVSLSANRLQATSGGRLFPPASLQPLQQAFLQGYFADESIPWRVIWLYEAQITLTRWAAALFRSRRQRGLRAMWHRTQLAVASRFYARYTDERLRLIDEASDQAHAANVASPQQLPGGVS